MNNALYHDIIMNIMNVMIMIYITWISTYYNENDNANDHEFHCSISASVSEYNPNLMPEYHHIINNSQFSWWSGLGDSGWST